MASPNSPKITSVGRQRTIDYLTKDYEGFRQAMLNQIPLRLPQWTDRNESDFGVVLIELFAYVADLLSYYQDRVANEAFLSTATQRRSVIELLRLIDYQIDPGLAASTFIHFEVGADVTVTGATLPYRVRTAGRPGEPDVSFEITQEFALRELASGIALAHLDAVPKGSSALAVARSDHALAEGDAIYLEETTSLAGTPRIRRSSMLRVTQIVPLDADNDEIRWLPPLAEPFNPQATTLEGNNVIATHGETIHDEPIFVSDGTPGQRMMLARKPVTHLLRREPLRRRRSSPQLIVEVDGTRWDHVDSLFESGPADTHFTTTIDENDVTTVVFGSGARGAVPPADSKIEARYRVGLGSAGNVGADTLGVFVTVVPEVESVDNPFAAEGGAERETIQEAKISGPGSIIAQERAVTLQDYELLAEGFPGVGKAKARVGLRGGYKVVQVYIAPENPQTIPPPPPASELKQALARYLEARMPVNRMAGVDVLDTRYVAVNVGVDVHLRAEASQAEVLAAIRVVLRELLSFANQDYGKGVRVGEVYSALYPVEGVAYVVLTGLMRSGEPAATGPCDLADVTMGEHEMAYEGQLAINLFGGS